MGAVTWAEEVRDRGETVFCVCGHSEEDHCQLYDCCIWDDDTEMGGYCFECDGACVTCRPVRSSKPEGS